MTARLSHAVARALAAVLNHGHTVTGAAARYACDPSSVRRALRRAGFPPLPAGRPRGTP